MNHSIVFFLFLTIIFTGCDSKMVYDKYNVIDAKGWGKRDTINFVYNSKDSISGYNLFLNVRNNNSYRYSNLYLIVDMEYPNGDKIKDTLQYQMADAQGNWLGYGMSGLKESKLWYKENFKFPLTGNYLIRINQAMREKGAQDGVDFLKGISDVGLRIETIEGN